MRILHYSLGFPPFRTGGMTKFCTDLMQRQLQNGDAVGLLWPGAITGGRTKVKKGSSVNGTESLEIINPLPVPYDEGIADIPLFTKEGDYESYRSFLTEWKPDAIHFHTLMGLHKNLIKAAKDMDIKLVFTVHDFFPLCPKVSMMYGAGVCRYAEDCSHCPQCNSTALSPLKMLLLQSSFYRKFKNRPAVTALRKKHRSNYFRSRQKANTAGSTYLAAEDYTALRRHYISMLSLMDTIHYNSSLTRSVYEKYFYHCNGIVMPVTHGDIQDKRSIKTFHEKLHITYMGPASSGKGYHRLKAASDMLKDSGRDFVLNIFFQPEQAEEYMNIHRRYSYSDLDEIFSRTDVLVAPTAAYDTFGFTVAEALSHGVPVIATENTGAKDIVPAGGGIIVKPADRQALYNALAALSTTELEEMNRAINKSDCIIKMDALCRKIKDIYS